MIALLIIQFPGFPEQEKWFSFSEFFLHYNFYLPLFLLIFPFQSQFQMHKNGETRERERESASSDFSKLANYTKEKNPTKPMYSLIVLSWMRSPCRKDMNPSPTNKTKTNIQRRANFTSHAFHKLPPKNCFSPRESPQDQCLCNYSNFIPGKSPEKEREKLEHAVRSGQDTKHKYWLAGRYT